MAAVHLSLDGGVTSETIYAAAHFNATKTPASVFRYYATTDNHALISIENLNETSGIFDISIKGVNVGDATVTVRAVAVERDVDAWKAETTFAVSVTADNADPTLSTLALADVSGDQVFNLTQYFTDIDDDDATLTYSVIVEEPLLVNANIVGSMLYLQNGIYREGRSLVTVTASDGYGNGTASFNSTYSFVFMFATHWWDNPPATLPAVAGQTLSGLWNTEWYFGLTSHDETQLCYSLYASEAYGCDMYGVTFDTTTESWECTFSNVYCAKIGNSLVGAYQTNEVAPNFVFAIPTFSGPTEPAFGGPNLLSAMPAFAFSGADAAPRGFAAANYFNATKTPASAFKYFVSTNNHALVSIEQLNETSGEFNLATKGVVGAGTVTVQAVAVERDVSVWKADTTFAVEVVNDLADPTLIQALPDVTNAGAVNLTQYFADTDGDLTYEVEVSDPAVVTASMVGDILTLANAANASGTATVTVRARDSNAQANDTFTVTFEVVSFQFTPVERIDFTASLCRPGSATAAQAPGQCHLAGLGYWLGRVHSAETNETPESYCYNLKNGNGWGWGETCGLKWTSGIGWTEHLDNLIGLDTTTTPGVVSIKEHSVWGWVGGFVDPYAPATNVCFSDEILNADDHNKWYSEISLTFSDGTTLKEGGDYSLSDPTVIFTQVEKNHDLQKDVIIPSKLTDGVGPLEYANAEDDSVLGFLPGVDGRHVRFCVTLLKSLSSLTSATVRGITNPAATAGRSYNPVNGKASIVSTIPLETQSSALFFASSEVTF
jgi:hypothetical protein